MWTPEMVAAALAIHSAEHPSFFRQNAKRHGVGIVRTLLNSDEMDAFRAPTMKDHRIHALRFIGSEAWRQQVYVDVCVIINRREAHEQKAT